MSQQYDPAQQLPPAGWYPDPVDQTQERYWDGASWTTRQRPLAQQPQYNPQPTAQPWPAADQQAGFQGGYAQAGYQPTGYQTQGYSQYQPQGYGPTTADGVPLAGWWRRVGATILDSLILMVISVIVVLPFADTLTVGIQAWFEDVVLAAQLGGEPPLYTDPQYGLTGPIMTITVISAVISAIYATVMLIWKGATLGQLASGLRVVPRDRGTVQQGLPFATALLRNVAYYTFSAITILSLINVLLPLFNPRRQTLHDMIARTQVVRIR